MKKDIMGNLPGIGDTIAHTMYGDTNSLFTAEVTGESPNGRLRVTAVEPKMRWKKDYIINGDFIILK